MRDEYPTGQIRGENGGEPQEHTQSQGIFSKENGKFYRTTFKENNVIQEGVLGL